MHAPIVRQPLPEIHSEPGCLPTHFCTGSSGAQKKSACAQCALFFPRAHMQHTSWVNTALHSL